MVAINNLSNAVATSMLPTSPIAQTNTPAPKPNKVTQKSEAVTPSTEVELSTESKMQQVVGQTSVQFEADPDSGKSVVTVVSKEDNHIIRKIPSPISSAMGKRPDMNIAHPSIDITV